MALYLFQIGLNSLVEAMQVILLAAGFLLTYNVSKLINLGMGAAFTLGAYSYYVGLHNGGKIEAFLLFIGSLFILSVINVKLLEPFIKKNLDLMGLLASVALWFFVQEAHVLFFGSQGRSIFEGVLPTLEFNGLRITWTALLTIAVSLCAALLTGLILLKTPYGRTMRAVKQHGPASSQLGINEKRIRFMAFFAALLLGGLVGVFTGMNEAMTPMSSHTLIIPSFLAFFVGGKDIRGIIIAALILVFLPSFIISTSFAGASISEAWKPVLVFALATIILFLRPNGLLTIQNRTA